MNNLGRPKNVVCGCLAGGGAGEAEGDCGGGVGQHGQAAQRAGGGGQAGPGTAAVGPLVRATVAALQGFAVKTNINQCTKCLYRPFHFGCLKNF